MKKLFLSALMAAAVLSASANVFYCDPASNKDDAQGTSWDDAVSVYMMREALPSLVGAGDTIFIKGGNINLESGNEAWVITGGITIIGGFDPSAKGVSSSLPVYPSATPTVFNGDANKDGVPSVGDSPMLIRVDMSGAQDAVVTLQGLDLINTYNTETGGSDDYDSFKDQASALRTFLGTVIVKNCHIYGHITPNCKGSQTITVVGSKFHMIDCEVHDGIAYSRGGLLRALSYFFDEAKENIQKPEIVLERCCFYNGNALGLNPDDPTMTLEARMEAKDASLGSGTYGGALHISAGPLYMINTSVLNNMTYANGGGISGNVDGFYFISSTIGHNEGIRDEHDVAASPKNCAYGSSLRMESDGTIKMANTFITDHKDNSKKQFAPIYQDGNTKMMNECITSAGYNVLGTFAFYPDAFANPKETWAATDLYSVFNGGADSVQTFQAYFGTIENLKDNGGFSKTLLPLAMQDGAAVADLQELANTWFPEWAKVDASVDQRGYNRDAAKTCVGAAAFEATSGSALTRVNATRTSNIKYNVLGQPVNDSYKGIVILNGQKYLQ